MVGHTGVFEAAVKAIEATDDGVGKVVDAILKMGGQCLITGRTTGQRRSDARR